LTPLARTPIDHDRIAQSVNAAHMNHKNKRRGKNAGYIPALAEVDPQLFGICVATVDGQTFSAGAAECQFALESISKVFTAALVMEQIGPRAFHRKVGADPTGAEFNSVLALELHNNKPMSPMVNAGAMTATSLVSATDAGDRWRQILEIQSDFAGRRLRTRHQLPKPRDRMATALRRIHVLRPDGGRRYLHPAVLNAGQHC
jgi:glutaminase